MRTSRLEVSPPMSEEGFTEWQLRNGKQKDGNLMMESELSMVVGGKRKVPPKLENFFGGNLNPFESNLSLFEDNFGRLNMQRSEKHQSGVMDLEITNPFLGMGITDPKRMRTLMGESSTSPEKSLTAMNERDGEESTNKHDTLSLVINPSSSDISSNVKSPQNKEVSVMAREPSPQKSIDTFGQRTSCFRGVTRHRWTGRYEAHLWDNTCKREGQTRKGRQVYLGGYDEEEKAARAYDLAALKYWGQNTCTNFPVVQYKKEIEAMKHVEKQAYIAYLRRNSTGFSRGASKYRGVTRHHQHGRWQARIGRVAGNKDLYLGTFTSQEEAAEAYDIAAIKFRGVNAVTNFDISMYDLDAILKSQNLPVGGNNKRKEMTVEPSSSSACAEDTNERQMQNYAYGDSYAIPNGGLVPLCLPIIAVNGPQNLPHLAQNAFPITWTKPDYHYQSQLQLASSQYLQAMEQLQSRAQSSPNGYFLNAELLQQNGHAYLSQNVKSSYDHGNNALSAGAATANSPGVLSLMSPSVPSVSLGHSLSLRNTPASNSASWPRS